jgi:hypothetical protein
VIFFKVINADTDTQGKERLDVRVVVSKMSFVDAVLGATASEVYLSH